MVTRVDAFIDAAPANPRARGIQVGFYQLKKQMTAERRARRSWSTRRTWSRTRSPSPRGCASRTSSSVARREDRHLASASTRRRSTTRPRRSGCPTYAKGNPEGYLFPATYDVRPRGDARTDPGGAWSTAGSRRPRTPTSRRRPRSSATRPQELMTVASLVEAEAAGRGLRQGRPGDLQPARPATRPTAAPARLDRQLRRRQRARRRRRPRSDLELDSPYNTYQHPGLPPAPIEAPGDAAIEAAPNPADGDWFYFVTATSRTGETKFSDDLRRVPAVQAGAAATTARPSPKAPAERARMRCAVLGAPIAHSLSPVLHRAAYAELGLDWTYDAAGAGAAGPAGRSSTGSTTTWRGLSLTMPLKREAAAARRPGDRHAPARRARPTRWCSSTATAARRQHRHPRRGGRAARAVRRRPSSRSTVLGGGATAASLPWRSPSSAAREVRLLGAPPERAAGDRGRGRGPPRPPDGAGRARSPTRR